MAFTLLIIVVALLNISLGFMGAMRLGFGPPGLTEAWEALTTSTRVRQPRIAPATVTAPGEAPIDDQAIEDMFEGLVAAPIDDMLEDEPDDDFDFNPEEEAYDDDAEQFLSPDSPEAWNVNDKYVETSILKLNVAMMKSGARATEIDTRLRAIKGNSDEATIQECLTKLKEDCESYLEEQAAAADKFRDRIGELGELRDIGEEIETTNLEQAAQIETTINNLGYMDFSSDLEAANERLLEEIDNLRAARHKLRDSQEVAFLTIARYEDRLDTIEEQLFNDSLTGLRNRIGLETTVWQWWQQKRHTSRQIMVAVFDIDRFGDFNEDNGCLIGDRVIKHIGGFLSEKAGRGSLVGRFSGQQFMLLTLDAGPRTAVKDFEFMRQSIERMRFTTGGQELTVTVTGGITEVTSKDTDDGVVNRAEEALKAAKAAGSNHSFLIDPKTLDPEPELVESPSLGAEYVEVPLQ